MRKRIDIKNVLRVLADRLTDDLLLDIFPEHAPGDIRVLLRDPNIEGEAETVAFNKSLENGKLPFSGNKDSTCSLYTDGASRGNPGDAGAGIVLFDDKGREILTRSLYLGKCTNNAAEYQALITGLESANEAGCKKLDIFMDSELIVRQILGIYKVKNEQLKPLFAKVQKLLAGLETWQIRHVPREKNCRADELANRGIDDASKHFGAGA